MNFDREEARQEIFALLTDLNSVLTQDRRLDVSSFKAENARIIRESSALIERWTEVTSLHRLDVALAREHAESAPHLAADLIIDVLSALRDELVPQSEPSQPPPADRSSD